MKKLKASVWVILAATAFIATLAWNTKIDTKKAYAFNAELTASQQASGEECVYLYGVYCPPDWGYCCYEGGTICRKEICA
jgi:hypothetical protein